MPSLVRMEERASKFWAALQIFVHFLESPLLFLVAVDGTGDYSCSAVVFSSSRSEKMWRCA